MTLAESSDGWHIQGAGAERAQIAWASEVDGNLVLSLEDASRNTSPLSEAIVVEPH